MIRTYYWLKSTQYISGYSLRIYDLSISIRDIILQFIHLFFIDVEINHYSEICVRFNVHYDQPNHCIGGSSGGTHPVPPPPKGPNSFVLTYKIFET